MPGPRDIKKGKPKEAPKAAEPVKKGAVPTPPVEEAPKPVEKKKEKKSQKDRPHSKTKHANVQIWKLYSNGKRKNEFCPRCGPGTFIAAFKNRKYCGKCGWAEVTKENKA